MLLAAFVFVPVCFGQDVGENSETVSIGFGTLAALVAIIPFVVELFKKAIPKASRLVVQIFSWVIGLVITFVAWWFGLGFLAGLSWWMMLIYGFGASLVANGVFDTGLVSSIIGLLFGKKK